MKVAILVEELFNDQEFWYPYFRLKEAGYEVVVVGSGRSKVYRGKAGTEAQQDLSAEQIDAKDFGGVVIPGGYAPDHIRRYPAMLRFVKELYDSGKTVAAICHAGWVLVSANILKGKKVTSFFAIKDDLINAGAEWLDAEVVVDGKLITSRKPDDLPAFMKEVLKALSA